MSLIFHTSNGEVFEYDGENLYHFGIKGMKWGVRRYQNPDGSLTPAGKARYNKLATKNLYLQSRRDFSNGTADRMSKRGLKTKDEIKGYNYHKNQVRKLDKKLDKINSKMDALALPAVNNAIKNKNVNDPIIKAMINKNVYKRWHSELDKLDKKWESKMKGYSDWGQSPLWDDYSAEKDEVFARIYNEEKKKLMSSASKS